MSMLVNVLPRNRKLFLWPAAAIVIAVIVSANSFYMPKISLQFGATAWLIAMALALVCWAHPFAARAGVLLTGVFMAIPSFLHAPSIRRGWLLCGMFLPLILASIPVVAPSVTGFRARLALLCSWDRTRELKRSHRYLNSTALLHCFLATIIFPIALGAVEIIPASGFWYLVRWLAGGVMIVIFAEIWTAFQNFLTAAIGLTAPLLMHSPFLSRSVAEFWAARWNPGASFMLRRLCYEPLARISPVLGLFAAFTLSGVAHALLFFVATLHWNISLINGLFFFVQPFFVLIERQLGVHRWPAPAGRAWTMAVLTLTSPMFVEPCLQAIGPVSVPVLFGTFIILGIVIFSVGLFLLAAVVSLSGAHGRVTVFDPSLPR
jgi:hypothetical protein